MGLFKGVNDHVRRNGKYYFFAVLFLIGFNLTTKFWEGCSTGTFTFMFSGNAVVTLETSEGVQEFVVEGVKRFEKRLQFEEPVKLSWFSTIPGQEVTVVINDSETVKKEKGEWSFITEWGCFISSLRV